MKVAFLTIMPSPYTLDLFDAMERDGRIQPRVFYLEMAAPDTYWEPPQLPNYATLLPGSWLPFCGARLHVNWGAPQAIAAEKPDVVVVAGYAGFTAQHVMRWLHRRQIPWIFWGERPGMRRRRGLAAALRWIATRPAVRWPTAIAAIGSQAQSAYREMAAAECPIVNIPYCCDLESFFAIPRNECPGPRIRFLYCGQLIPRKGVDVLLEAFCDAAAACPQIDLTLVGEGPLRAALEAKVPSGLRDRIRFTGFQPVGALPSQFADADVFVLPSRHDGWGVVVNQAVAAGMPVLCSDAVGAGADLVVENENGHRFPPGNAVRLRQAIEAIAVSGKRIAVMGHRSRELAAQWTPRRSVDRWVDLCRHVCPEGSGALRVPSAPLLPTTADGTRSLPAASRSSADPIRVLLVSASSGSQGGGELYLPALAEGLTALGHRVEALLSRHPRMDALAGLLEPWARVHRMDYTNTYDRKFRVAAAVLDRRTIRRVRDQIQAIRPDVIHLNKQNLEDGLDLLFAGAQSTIPLVSTIHITRSPEALGAAGAWLRGGIARRVLKRVGGPYLAIAHACREELVAQLGGPASGMAVYCVHNGVGETPSGNRKAIRKAWNCREGDFVLGCLARIESQKDPLFLVGLLSDLPEHVRLVWIGDGRLRAEMLATAERLGVRHRIHVDGWRSDARSRLAGFDLFVLPSRYEGLPLAILEAMAEGLPCVASDVDGTREAIGDGVSGRLCAPGDRGAWLACLRDLIANRFEFARLGREARRRYLDCFSLEAMARATAEVYRKVMEDARR